MSVYENYCKDTVLLDREYFKKYYIPESCLSVKELKERMEEVLHPEKGSNRLLFSESLITRKYITIDCKYNYATESVFRNEIELNKFINIERLGDTIYKIDIDYSKYKLLIRSGYEEFTIEVDKNDISWKSQIPIRALCYEKIKLCIKPLKTSIKSIPEFIPIDIHYIHYNDHRIVERMCTNPQLWNGIIFNHGLCKKLPNKEAVLNYRSKYYYLTQFDKVIQELNENELLLKPINT